MITTVNFSLFPSDELFTFSKGVLAIVEPKKEQITALTPFVEKAARSVTLYQSALERERKNPFTLLLVKADSKRDSSFMAFRMYIEAATYRNMEGWYAAASKIAEIIRRHGWSAASFGYKAETAALTNIISEVKTKCAAELVLTAAIEWLTELETAQQAFDDVFHQSVTAAPTNEPTVWEVRPALVNSIKSLLSIIALLQSGTPSRDLSALETALNELIVRSLSTIKAAGTRAENAKKEEEDKQQVQ